ncbi:hypothetical protein EDD16DRAFT_1575805, partial [Pisolithus croceorrhizus]
MGLTDLHSMCLLGLTRNFAHDTSAITSNSLLIRDRMRKIYRTILSEPKLVFPSAPQTPDLTVQGTDLNIRQAPQVPPNDHTATTDVPSSVEADTYASKWRVREDSIFGSTTPNPCGSAEGPLSHSISNSSRRLQKRGKLV